MCFSFGSGPLLNFWGTREAICIYKGSVMYICGSWLGYNLGGYDSFSNDNGECETSWKVFQHCFFSFLFLVSNAGERP